MRAGGGQGARHARARVCAQCSATHIRTYALRVHALALLRCSRIEANYPTIRFPWGFLGCGSWNEDNVRVHHFDRGSFGFRQVPCGSPYHCCFIWEPFGEVVGRQRCPCNGPLYSHGKLNCNQWCCDHWCMTLCCCHYQYPGARTARSALLRRRCSLQARPPTAVPHLSRPSLRTSARAGRPGRRGRVRRGRRRRPAGLL